MFGSTAITRVTSMNINPGGALSKFKADANIYPVVAAVVDVEPTVSVTSADVGTLYGFAIGSTGTITATLLDANQASGGAINFTCLNANFVTPDMSASHAQFASSSARWDLLSSDGVTSPISFTRS